MKMSSRPPRIPAASFERKGFQTRYSVFVDGVSPLEMAVGWAEDSTEMRFSP